jgi:hypothetical protein
VADKLETWSALLFEFLVARGARDEAKSTEGG